MARLLPKKAGRILEAKLNYLCSLVEASAIDPGLENLPWFCIPDSQWVADCSVIQIWTDFGTLISEYLCYFDFATLT